MCETCSAFLDHHWLACFRIRKRIDVSGSGLSKHVVQNGYHTLTGSRNIGGLICMSLPLDGHELYIHGTVCKSCFPL